MTTTTTTTKVSPRTAWAALLALTDDHFLSDGGHYRANVILPAGDGRRAMYARTIHGYDPYLSEQNYELGDGARTLRFVGWTL